MIVADTNLVVHLVLGGRSHDVARAIFRRDPEWAAPVLWRSEFRNVIATEIRAGSLTLENGWSYAEEAERLLHGREFHPDTHAVLALAARSRCTAYDCEFVAVAEALDVPLVTADREVLRAFPGRAVLPHLL